MPLSQKSKNSVKFDANNADHRKAYRQFTSGGKWPISFEIELPFTNVPALAMFRLAEFACSEVNVIPNK